MAELSCSLFKELRALPAQSGLRGADSPQATRSGRGDSGSIASQALRGPGQEHPYPIPGTSPSQGEGPAGLGCTSQCPLGTWRSSSQLTPKHPLWTPGRLEWGALSTTSSITSVFFSVPKGLTQGLNSNKCQSLEGPR